MCNSDIRFLVNYARPPRIKMTHGKKILEAKMYRSKATLTAKSAYLSAMRNGSGVAAARSAYQEALSNEILEHKNKTIPIFQTGTITGDSPVAGNTYTMANYFAVPGKWTYGANPNAFALYAYFDEISAGTMDPYTYALGIITNYNSVTASEDLYPGKAIDQVQLTSSGFGTTEDGFSNGLVYSADGSENALFDQQEIQLIISAIGIDQEEYGVFYQNNTIGLFDLKYNGSITQLIGTQNIYLTNNTSPYANVNTFTFVTDFNSDSYFWLWILFLGLFLILAVIYFDVLFPTPRENKALVNTPVTPVEPLFKIKNPLKK